MYAHVAEGKSFGFIWFQPSVTIYSVQTTFVLDSWSCQLIASDANIFGWASYTKIKEL